MVVALSPHDHIIPLWDSHRSSFREYRLHQIRVGKTQLKLRQGMSLTGETSPAEVLFTGKSG